LAQLEGKEKKRIKREKELKATEKRCASEIIKKRNISVGKIQ
jgi:hypothetical protein